MKRILSMLLLAVLSATLVPAVYAQGGCTNATLKGNYGFNFNGFIAPGKSPKGREVPWDVVGVFTADGAGNVSISYTAAINGTADTAQTASGSYTVNPDCTGSVSYTAGDAAGLTFNMVILGGGEEVFAISTTAGSTATVDLKKQ